MRIRFLQTTPSANPDIPFQAGQTIEVATLTPAMRRWLEPIGDGVPLAVLVPEAPEAAMVAPAERAVQPRAKGRTA